MRVAWDSVILGPKVEIDCKEDRTMPAITRNLLIEQGATGVVPGLFVWHDPRHVFTATVAGTSDLAEPTWPTSNCDCDEIVDNTVTWACTRTATQSDWEELSLWCADKDYAVGDTVISPKSPKDLTGYTALIQFRTREADDLDSELLFSMTETADADGNYVELGDAAGTIELVIQAETSVAWEWVDAEYDLELTSGVSVKYPNGFVTRLLQGTVTVSKERSRA